MSNSRWGPPISSSRSITPVPPTSGQQQSRSNNGNSNSSNAYYQSPFVSNLDFLKTEDPEFELIDTVEWGLDDASPTEELAARPKPDRSDDPCGCVRPDDPTVMTCNGLHCVLFACQEECRSNCDAGEQCGNKRIQRRLWKRLEVFDAGKKGKGLRVLEDVKQGDLVTEYVGRAVNKLFLPRLFRRYTNERKLYIMALTGDVYLDARKKGGVARYINHSCNPNCVVERWKVRGILRAAVVARRDIPAGTELSFDYQWERKRGRAPTKCYCGDPNCRGTLEVPRSMEEEALERKLSQHWKKPLISRAGKEIVNRCIKLFSTETQEYYPADVIQYDDKTGKHLLMYRRDLDEVWEDLKKEDWMILDEEAEQFIIRKKSASNGTTSSSSGRSLLGAAYSTIPGMLLQGQQQQAVGLNYVYTYTPIKEALFNKHLIERCQRSCRVTITPQQYQQPEVNVDDESSDNPEFQERVKMLQSSPDGSVWKLIIVGSDVVKARSILEKNVAFLMSKDSASSGNNESADTLQNGNAEAAKFSEWKTVAVDGNSTEVILPRAIVDVVKKRLPHLREKCRSVKIEFVPSESKSKQFGKLNVSGTLVSDMELAKDQLWNQLNSMCSEIGVPKTPFGIYKDLVFLGGIMSSSDFNRLLEYDKTNSLQSTSSTLSLKTVAGSSVTAVSLNQDAKEDLSKLSPFFSSFEATQRCTVWVQSDLDKGRIDGSNRLVDEATPNSPKKIYFGCDPKVVNKLWKLVEARAAEVARGVKYLYLGADRLYQPQLMQNNGQFFDFVKNITGASVSVDAMTGDHLRIDGAFGGFEKQPPELPTNLSEGEKASLAEELIRLQIELYRDHCIRQESWMFGRDWALERKSALSYETTDALIIPPGASTFASRTSLSRNSSFDAKTVANAAFEIADIASALEISGETAAHASILMYRFITIVSQAHSVDTQIKIRDLIVVCIFIANKANKATKWKRLDAILEAAYNVFYPGSQFDPTNKESTVWEERVISAEAEILERLQHDFSCRGFQWIVAAATDSAGLSQEVVRDILSFSVCGAVLAAGPDLWLTYGEQYVFAASAAFMNASLHGLVAGLSVIPIKIFQAAELIVTSISNTTFGKKQADAHPLFKGGIRGLRDHLSRIKSSCAAMMSSDLALNLSENEQRYRIIRDRHKERRTYLGIQRALINESIIPAIDGIAAESNCGICIDKNQLGDFYDITLVGSWRAISIASYLLKDAVKEENKLGRPVEKKTHPENGLGSILAKGKPGWLRMKLLEDGWSGTIQSQISDQTVWSRKTGGRCCIPAKVKEADLRECGLRWWIPPRYGPSSTGSICDMFLVDGETKIDALGYLSNASQGWTAAFSMLTASAERKSLPSKNSDRFVAVSLHRWPSEKVAAREQVKRKNSDTKNIKKPRKPIMEVGFSPGALQELQLLRQLHGLIDSPQGHPNLYLPIGVAMPSEHEPSDKDDSIGPHNSSLDMKSIDEDIFSLTRSSLENEAAARKDQKRREMVNEPHLVFQPTPFVLQRFVSKKKKMDAEDNSKLLSPEIFASWCFDLLSAVLHCHENGIVLRSFQLDQIVVDHSGVAKIGSLYRSAAMSNKDGKMSNRKILDLARQKKNEEKSKRKDSRKGDTDDSEDILKDLYVSPEALLGSPKHTKETDMWSLGCMLSHLLLNKAVFPIKGRDRESLLTAMYKIVGVPASKTEKFPIDNFPLGVKFPFYTKPSKKYTPGVEKALTKMLKERGGGDEYTGAIDLISQMLRLDPEERITAKGGLQHEYISSFLEESAKQSFQEKFAQEWMTLKNKLTKSGMSDSDRAEQERGFKRNAMLMAASGASVNLGDDDGLYDLGDVLGVGSSKRQKT
ncbi:nuclear protein SET [Nitzschia inconspicua]|uniref:Nuclear protein SET n=1 Tax=Nitzschia inconspicua TaxID=303405 RepID=A0A9K3L0A0_9STRA|nr:nuclear protein SET [Nitzschia inconspicua]